MKSAYLTRYTIKEIFFSLHDWPSTWIACSDLRFTESLCFERDRTPFNLFELVLEVGRYGWALQN